MMPSFSLVKWYMDCVTEQGEAAIVYCAELKWKSLHAHIGSCLTAFENHPPVTRTSLGRYVLNSSAERIEVVHPRLKVQGIWERDAQPFQRKLYEEGGGASVVWDCLQPRSRVTVSIGDRQLIGLGYAECLRVTIAPWKLPLRELHWGRFVGENRSLTWVDWKGPYATTCAVLDSQEVELSCVTQERVIAGEDVLSIAPGLALRDGRLGETILPGASGLRRLFPQRLFGVEEEKHLSRGTLTGAGRDSSGWVIHEVVKWEL